MLKIGAHMSVAGGVSLAVDRAALHGCEALQIFAKNASQWRGRPLDPDDVRRFRTRLDETGISPVVSHASYLINLATTAPALRAQSIEALVDELARADTLGLDGVVLHPGTCTAGTVSDAVALVASAVRDVLRARPKQRARLLLEHTAGQGRTVGSRFEELATVIEHLDGTPLVGVCLDTCHLVAAGYDIATAHGYASTMASCARTIGLDRVRVLHANDSKTPLGSRVDRHEHIGQGHVGIDAFRRLLHDPRLSGRPLLIETAKTTRTGRPGLVGLDDLDVRNLSTLRALRADGASPS